MDLGVKFTLNIFRNKNERFLLLLTILSFIGLCLVEARFPLATNLKGSFLGSILCSNGTRNILSGLLIGIISAYIFYLFIDYLPRVRKEQRTLDVLNALIASILDAYKRCRVFGHETAISHVDKSVLEESWLQEQIPILKRNESNFLPLKFAMQTAYTRLEDFRHTLPLAVTLSPEHTMQWLVIIDKVRLMAESYGEQPEVEISIENQRFINKDNDKNPMRDYKSTLNLRFLEIIEESQCWLYKS
jgi:hypothetical protein